MKALKALLVVWIFGMLVGLAFMERWRRLGLREAASQTAAAEASPTVAESAPGAAQRVTTPIIAGAKSDLHSVSGFASRTRDRCTARLSKGGVEHHAPDTASTPA